LVRHVARTASVAFGSVVLDLLLGILAIALGIATYHTGGTTLASTVGAVLAGMGVVLFVGALIHGLSGRARRR
jgi:hypothetical protein